MRFLLFSLLPFLALTACAEPAEKHFLPAEKAKLNRERVEIVGRKVFDDGKGVMLKPGVAADFSKSPAPVDLTFRFTIKEPGRYWIESVAGTFGETAERMKRTANKNDSPTGLIGIDGAPVVSRVVIFPWKDQQQHKVELLKHNFTAGEPTIAISLPPGVGLDRINIIPYRAPHIPAAPAAYRPAVVPGAAHPRLWFTPESRDAVKANLTLGENRPVWEKMLAEAQKPFPPLGEGFQEAPYDIKRLRAAGEKAFVCQMTGDRAVGREALALMLDYLPRVNFGNMLGVTRQTGMAIYYAALVYDWTFDLSTPAERKLLRDRMLQIAEDMEIGWPPFAQEITNGHGNEEQVNRDLLSAAIAMYGEENEPYKLCSYRIFEELIPMRAFEYDCSRHNQGLSYGSWRLGCEIHAAWLLRRMTGREIFAPNLKNMYQIWLYGRQPEGEYFIADGDTVAPGRVWALPRTALLLSAYAADPLVKGDFERMKSEIFDAIVFLAINDPKLKAEPSLESLPPTAYFKGALPSMIARTGWTLGADSPDLLVEMKGGRYRFANHQHPDAGAFQIYWRGPLSIDLGQYRFYGTPYDNGFTKRSISHNVLLVLDPAESFGAKSVNDGGQRQLDRPPRSLKELTADPQFTVGKTLGADFGPDLKAPAYSYLKSDLAASYSDKVKSYTRSFCFLRQDSPAAPGVLLVFDRIETARPEFKKFWVLNTMTRPEVIPGGITALSLPPANVAPGRLSAEMKLPADCEIVTTADGESPHVFGKKLEAPTPDCPLTHAYRTTFSPKQPKKLDCFFAVLQIGEKQRYQFRESENFVECVIGGWTVIQAKTELSGRFQLKLSAKSRVLITGLAPGAWRVNGQSFQVSAETGTLYAELPAGNYTVEPAV